MRVDKNIVEVKINGRGSLRRVDKRRQVPELGVAGMNGRERSIWYSY